MHKMKLFFGLLSCFLLLFKIAEAQDTIVRPVSGGGQTIELVNPYQNQVRGTNIITGSGNNTVTLWDRSKYINQPKSVVLPNAKETFADGMEVPKPSLDRPITDPWDDLKQGYACQAILNRPYYFQLMNFGEYFDLDITFVNTGTQTWDFNIDVMMYTGDQLQANPDRYVFDLWETVDPNNENIRTHIVKPGESIRVKIPMRAPLEKYHDDNKYYAAYTLVRNWNDFGWTEYLKNGNEIQHSSYDALHDGRWDRLPGQALFCPVYFYIYVP